NTGWQSEDSMTNAASRRTLRAIFELNSGDRSPLAEERGLTNLPLPTLDDRVDIYLRAVRGRDCATTPGERAAAREQILDTMADDLIREMFEKKNVEITEKRPILMSGAIANRMTAICSDVFRSFLQMLSDATEVFTIRGVRMAAVSLVVVLIAGTILSATWLYVGPHSGLSDRNSQIASRPD